MALPPTQYLPLLESSWSIIEYINQVSRFVCLFSLLKASSLVHCLHFHSDSLHSNHLLHSVMLTFFFGNMLPLTCWLCDKSMTDSSVALLSRALLWILGFENMQTSPSHKTCLTLWTGWNTTTVLQIVQLRTGPTSFAKSQGDADLAPSCAGTIQQQDPWICGSDITVGGLATCHV